MRVKQGEAVVFTVTFVDSAQAGVTGLTPTATIFRDDTNQFWNGSIWTTASTINLTAVDATNLPGAYQGSFTAPSADTTVFVMCKTTSGSVVNKVWDGFLIVGNFPATPADVNAQVIDVLSVDTQAELSAIPGSTPTMLQMLQFVFQWFKNKVTQTATTTTVFKDNSSTPLGTSATADSAGTFTKDKFS